jgi:uncharacterized protein
MDTLFIVIGFLLVLLGLAGSVLPFLPGPPLVYASLILLQFTSTPPFTVNFLVIWALVTVVIVLLDYYIPVWGTKKFGGSRGGTWGATIGLVFGIFLFPPLGIILGPFIGAFVGELVTGQNSDKALRSAIGSFIGFIAGTFMKLMVCLLMGYYFVRAVL